MDTKGNGYPEDDLMVKINSYFERFNVFAMPSTERMFQELWVMLNRGRRDPVDQVYDFVDELLQDGPI